MAANETQGVLLIYTGGTIGSVVKDKTDPLSPLVPGKMEQIIDCLPNTLDRGKQKFPPHKRQGDSDRRTFVGHTDRFVEHSIRGLGGNWEGHRKKISEYEGFIILHGTDTLAYTSSCLAFMIDDLSKPIVITGSQKPIGSTRSDAVQNIVSAIEIAAAKSLGMTVVPEVTVLFQENLYRGCRLRKVSASSYRGFDTPNLPPLATLGEHLVIHEEFIRTAEGKPKIGLAEKLESDVLCRSTFLRT